MNKIITYTQIQEHLSTQDDTLPSFKISVLRNIVIDQIEPYLRYFGSLSGLGINVEFGEYDNILQDVLQNDGEKISSSNCILIFTNLEQLSWPLARSISSLSREQLEAEFENITGLIKTIVEGIRRHSGAMILWPGFTRACFPNYGAIDSHLKVGHNPFIDRLNNALVKILESVNNAFYVDLNNCLARVGYDNFFDNRYWHIGKAPMAPQGLQVVAEECLKYIRALAGKNRKCLILDCDNTLWGGILGEDGIQGVRLGRNHPGSSFWEFQHEIVNLYNRGIILALCSKNNEADVWEMFETHPHMVLKKEHIAAHRINWDNKTDNIRDLAAELNIGLDSMVFMDDSEFEVNLIRETIPEVLAVHLPPGKAIEHRETLAAIGVFDTLTFSEEDRKRGEMYRAESRRKKLRSQLTDLTAYYSSLEMALEIKLADQYAIPRIAQLTQKTNQFNLTTIRYSEEEIASFSSGDETDVLYLRLKDKYGDSGIVGVCILTLDREDAFINTFLLSCRVLGRGVEDAFLACTLYRAKQRGARRIIGEYRPTRKNEQVAGYYEKNNFVVEEDTGQSKKYSLDLGTYELRLPDFFEEIHCDFIS